MPLTEAQEYREHELRVDQMSVNIEKMRSDMEAMQKWETRKFLLQFVVAIVASVGAGVALANWVNSRNPLPQPPQPPQIIYLQPISPPAAPPAVAR